VIPAKAVPPNVAIVLALWSDRRAFGAFKVTAAKDIKCIIAKD